MSDGYWVAAYVLAGVAVVLLVVKYFEHDYEHHMSQREKRQWETLHAALQAQPAVKALMALVLWLFWPLLALYGIAVGVVFSALWVYDYVLDGVDWVVEKVKRRG